MPANLRAAITLFASFSALQNFRRLSMCQSIRQRRMPKRRSFVSRQNRPRSSQCCGECPERSAMPQVARGLIVEHDNRLVRCPGQTGHPHGDLLVSASGDVRGRTCPERRTQHQRCCDRSGLRLVTAAPQVQQMQIDQTDHPLPRAPRSMPTFARDHRSTTAQWRRCPSTIIEPHRATRCAAAINAMLPGETAPVFGAISRT